MNRLLSPALALAALAAAPALSLAQEKAPPAEHAGRYDDVMARNAWWREARFGMFIHFGAYAVPARGEWVAVAERISVEKYRPLRRELPAGRLRREGVGAARPGGRHEATPS